VLLLGHDRSDPLFLQVKEAERSVLERFADTAGLRPTVSAWSKASG
jgi:hypothetical protein